MRICASKTALTCSATAFSWLSSIPPIPMLPTIIKQINVSVSKMAARFLCLHRLAMPAINAPTTEAAVMGSNGRKMPAASPAPQKKSPGRTMTPYTTIPGSSTSSPSSISVMYIERKRLTMTARTVTGMAICFSYTFRSNNTGPALNTVKKNTSSDTAIPRIAGTNCPMPIATRPKLKSPTYPASITISRSQSTAIKPAFTRFRVSFVKRSSFKPNIPYREIFVNSLICLIMMGYLHKYILQGLIPGKLFGSALRHQLPCRNHGNAVAQLLRHLQYMSGEKDSAPPFT